MIGNYVYKVKVVEPRVYSMEQFKEYLSWASGNRIKFKYRFGALYFSREEDAMAFKLVFG